jgi:hypothetical protein
VNAGLQGVCIESAQSFEPGTRISIEMVPPDKGPQESVSRLRRGKVIWCQPVASGRDVRYGAGVEIFERVVQAEIPVLSLF